MLKLEEIQKSLSTFKLLSILNILPIGVDVKSGKIQRQSNQVKFFIWKIFFGVGISHWFYIFGRLVQSKILEPERYFRWDHFILHFGITLGYAVFYFVAFRLFVKTPEENVMIFNQLFQQRGDPVQKIIDQQLQMNPTFRNGNQYENQQQNQVEKQSESESKVSPRPLLTWPPQYPLDELVVKLFPPIGLFTGFFTILILAVDPTRPQLLYSFLPPEYQNYWSFLILLTVEVLSLTIVTFTGAFAVVTQIIFFGKCQWEFKRMSLQLRNLQAKFQSPLFGVRQIEKEVWMLRQILEEMRELEVLIELFNLCFPFCIFAWKICSLSVCILFYFFAVRHHEDFPFLAGFLAYTAIVIAVTYTIMYAHAFSIPGKMEELKHEFLLTAQKTTRKTTTSKSTSDSNANVNSNGNQNTTVLWAEMQREMKRIRGVGIKVGSFHSLERESTPNFVDFVLRTVVTLLVTFPR